MQSGSGRRAKIQCESEGGSILRDEWIQVSDRGSIDAIHDSVIRYAERTLGNDVDSEEAENLMLGAYYRAQQMLESEDCEGLYGTAETRANGWSPQSVLGKLFFGQGGLGSIGYGPTLTLPALTSVTIAGGSLGSRTNINQSYFVAIADNERERALTLLHELGHAFNFLSIRGSGGSAIEQGDWLGGQERNETRVWVNCGVVKASPR